MVTISVGHKTERKQGAVEHHFNAVTGGVEMTDAVHDRNPFGFFLQTA